jgi:hypothetical protein
MLHMTHLRTPMLAVACLLASCVGTPHLSSTEVTTVEVSVYKLGMATGCRDAGRRRGDPATKVDAFCGCMAKTLEERVTADEWKQATFFAQQRRDADEQRVLSPHMQALSACREVAQ